MESRDYFSSLAFRVVNSRWISIAIYMHIPIPRQIGWIVTVEVIVVLVVVWWRRSRRRIQFSNKCMYCVLLRSNPQLKHKTWNSICDDDCLRLSMMVAMEVLEVMDVSRLISPSVGMVRWTYSIHPLCCQFWWDRILCVIIFQLSSY